jgi:hypothetical protein
MRIAFVAKEEVDTIALEQPLNEGEIAFAILRAIGQRQVTSA